MERDTDGAGQRPGCGPVVPAERPDGQGHCGRVCHHGPGPGRRRRCDAPQSVPILSLLHHHAFVGCLHQRQLHAPDGGGRSGHRGGAVHLLAPQRSAARALLPLRPPGVFPGPGVPARHGQHEGLPRGFLRLPAELFPVVRGVSVHLWGAGPVCAALHVDRRDDLYLRGGPL